jgi:S1-C subfamily serine protease
MDELLPEGWLGLGINCNNCGNDGSSGVFRFREPPTVMSVEPNSPTGRAGMRPGDQLTHVDGVSLTSEQGWPRWHAIKPGQEVRLTYTRDGRSHHATISALSRP